MTSKMPSPLIRSNTEKERKMMRMASKDDNKNKYAVDGAEEEADKAPLKKQKTIGDDDNSDNHNNDSEDHDDDGNDEGDDDGTSSSSSTDDDYSSEPEEEMNIPTGSKEKLLI
jgi:hypothetical protein